MYLYMPSMSQTVEEALKPHSDWELEAKSPADFDLETISWCVCVCYAIAGLPLTSLSTSSGTVLASRSIAIHANLSLKMPLCSLTSQGLRALNSAATVLLAGIGFCRRF